MAIGDLKPGSEEAKGMMSENGITGVYMWTLMAFETLMSHKLYAFTYTAQKIFGVAQDELLSIKDFDFWFVEKERAVGLQVLYFLAFPLIWAESVALFAAFVPYYAIYGIVSLMME